MDQPSGEYRNGGTRSRSHTDPVSYRLVIALLGMVGLACIAGITYLTATHKEPSGALHTLAGTAVGGLAGLLAPQPRTH